jgi:hypothetical protein
MTPLTLPLTRTDWLACWFIRYSLRTDPTENSVPLLTWVTWYHVLHCSGTVRQAPDRMATLLTAALLLLREVTAVAETCLPSCSLAMAVSLAPLFRLSGVISQYISSKLAITYIEFSIVLLTKFQNAHVPSLLVSRSITFAVNRYGFAAC